MLYVAFFAIVSLFANVTESEFECKARLYPLGGETVKVVIYCS